MGNSSIAMADTNLYDLGGYTSDGSLILLGEVKASSDSSEDSAKVFRRNLIAHELLPRRVYFLLANRKAIYLWKPQSSEDAPPDYQSSAEPVLAKYLGTSIRNEAVGEAGLEFAFKHWLSGVAQPGADPRLDLDADQMLVNSGLYSLLKGGEVRYELVA